MPTALERTTSSLRRIATIIAIVFGLILLAYVLWRPGLNLRDGRHDRGSNAIWLAHGWLGADEWFTSNHKTDQFARYRDPASVKALVDKLRAYRITDIYPHLCPSSIEGNLPAVDAQQTERFLDAFAGFRVIPWIGGPNGSGAHVDKSKWRETFVRDAQQLLVRHPRLSGVQVNIEPMPSGDRNFLELLEELRAALPPGKILSVAAYPPPTRWHPFPEVHWEEKYFREVAKRCDQLAVMMYDAGQRYPKTYQQLMSDWTVEVLSWSEGKPVLLGVPTYDDAGVGYHDPRAENITNALLGIHRGLTRKALPSNYQGAAIYCDWEMSNVEWAYWKSHFCKE